MQRSHQLLFVVSWLVICWLGMQAVHELGHVAGAWLTRGQVQRVVLHPLAISRTDVAPNPAPGVVVWLGPILGCLLPLAAAACLPKSCPWLRGLATFFAGFCLIANGAYIACGSFDRIGDSGEMLRTGSPQWILIAFGVIASAAGLLLWHRLGDVGEFFRSPALISGERAYTMLGLLVLVVVLKAAISAS